MCQSFFTFISVTRTKLIEFLTILKDDFQPKAEPRPNETKPLTGSHSISSESLLQIPNNRALNTDQDIADRVDECFRTNNNAEELDLNQVLDYFLGKNDKTVKRTKRNWTKRMKRIRHRESQRQKH
ncbi:unnamed protein product [Didymodactylos carnosus]|uniref:Uncharacterized protein n=1 Tax=Didymodactylos carnosus TaxID=1234261 RepID=A0A8S2F515_9BILA|nr:unnamed protein product [Didymodactylos carnosus]CAF4153449.1 unnamed protein product [Didymodactylos carnosus]